MKFFASRTTRSLFTIAAIATFVLAGCGSEEKPSSSEADDQSKSQPKSTMDREEEKAQKAPPVKTSNHATKASSLDNFGGIALKELGMFTKPVAAFGVPLSKGATNTDQSVTMVVEQQGNIFVLTTNDRHLLVDLTDETDEAGERGLLGAAVHPNFPDDSRLFTNHTDSEGHTNIVEWKISGAVDSGNAKATKSSTLLTIEQPYENHNGGHLAFGHDGYLYIGMGDGGDAGDTDGNGQNVKTLLGAMLRVDVDSSDGGYDIPEGQPIANDAEPEIWAYGMRNPWRYSFDRETGDLWIGDVGQNEWEEVDVLPAGTPPGMNLGWNTWEGAERFDGGDPLNEVGPLVGPAHVYDRDAGCSVSGGYVYRGNKIKQLRGWYIFADFCKDEIRAIPAHKGVSGISKFISEGGGRSNKPVESAAEMLTPPISESDVVSWPGTTLPVSFGEEVDGELLIVSHDGGVYRIIEA